MSEPKTPSAGQEHAPHRPLTEFYENPGRRSSYVAHLFNRSAEHYDWASNILAFGSDRVYRKMALQKAGLRPGMQLLDVATGTGLVARAALEMGLARHEIMGVDPSSGMLSENQKNTGVQLVRGRGETLPFKEGAFDFISMGYALRHVEDLGVFFLELKRVLKPGGTVLILEISRPSSSLVYALLKLYLNTIVPALSRLRTNTAELRELLKYYWATIAECVPPPKITEALQQAGFSQVERRRFGPVLNDYYALKPLSPV